MQIIDLRDFEAIPQDFPVGKAAQLEFRKQWATQIVDEIWLPYPVEQISAILRGADSTDAPIPDEDDFVEELECLKCGKCKSLSISFPL
jgi:hypothetical protein